MFKKNAHALCLFRNQSVFLWKRTLTDSCAWEVSDKESKAEIFVKDGAISEIRFSDVAEVPPLEGRTLRDFKTLVTHEAESIVESWNAFFEEDKHIEPKLITRRIK